MFVEPRPGRNDDLKAKEEAMQTLASYVSFRPPGKSEAKGEKNKMEEKEGGKEKARVTSSVTKTPVPNAPNRTLRSPVTIPRIKETTCVCKSGSRSASESAQEKRKGRTAEPARPT